MKKNNLTGIILAGGKNSRIKTNKSLLRIGDETIIENIISKFKNIFNEILVVANNSAPFNHLTDNHLTRVVKDIIPDRGSLGGLYSGLVNSKSEYNFVAACDMPFLNTELIKYMVNRCGDFDIITPKLKHGYETLHTIYSKNCIDTIEKQLKKDKLKIRDIFSQFRVKEIENDIIKQFDSRLLSFLNINTDAEYKQALNIAPSHRS